MLLKLTSSPYFTMFSGLVLAISAGLETINTLDEFSLSSHHGVLLFGIFQILKSLSEILEGIKDMESSASQEVPASKP